MSRVQRFPCNTQGRDFAIGDVHGCFDALRDAMASVEFDEGRDRLFSVGDLVDRGPSSEEAVDWIARPWFHAVRGNHEQMAIGVAAGRHDQANYLRNGGGWFLALDNYRQQLTAQAFDTLPVAIEIAHTLGRIGIVHADIWGGSWDDFTAEIEGDLSSGRRHKLVEVALWSRSRIQARDASGIADLFALFVGHTPVERPIALGNVVYIDTGAVFGNGLTMIEIGKVRAAGGLAEAA
jgi:serine/threonine protein phosphatase 1